MRIAVVTMSNTKNNYGQVLQFLATRDFLKLMGHDVLLLRPKTTQQSLWRKKISSYYQLIKGICSRNKQSKEMAEKKRLFAKWNYISELMEKKHPRHFDSFYKKNFCIVEDDIENFKNYDYDAVCSGSDQIWTFNPYFTFLEFAPDSKKKFSIAPSIGHLSITDQFVNRVRRPLSKYTFITVREKNGLELCRKAGRNDAHLVLDPTFLLDAEDYSKYTKETNINVAKPYIFLYLLGADIPTSLGEIYEFAKQHDFDVKYVASQGREDERPKSYATVEEWLTLIAKADFVITNSFHGTALSIIHHKPFIVFPIAGILSSMNERIDNLLEKFNLNDRIYSGCLEKLFCPINWECANSSIEKNKSEMISLMKSLKNNH